MNKSSKTVLSFLFIAVFCMLAYCIVQVNTTQQGIMYLTQQLALEVAGDSGQFESSSTPEPAGTPTSEAVTPGTETVYWVPNGKVWHTTPDCPALSQSSNILSGSIEDSGKERVCKKCG